MTSSQKVDAFIENSGQWIDELKLLRQIFNSTELIENFKWGAPIYTINNKNVVGMVGFKNHLGIWFYQGVFLKDAKGILINAQKGKTKGLRQLRINKGDKIEKTIVLNYTIEAIENCKAGKEIKPENKKTIIPTVLKEAFKEDTTLSDLFKKLTPGKQREYAEFITTAKQETTKLNRLEKIRPMIKNGVGLHDKYKKS
ncbi:hypothetical protein ULMS_14090 [Patiriisocius marinistellae]|uniref:YdhG-like domain-containing protein n=1 Tax=Patiriisocius marinistellae TaxID=2494560 RepID=A0A5J4G1L6_9FLAO|nr:YdeI/OmpD-associated family protein [Patiriisocius marinistellae]GEQ85901.1 hypothetical protein ULMS_14090 [Patiriisocius marinistellae]